MSKERGFTVFRGQMRTFSKSGNGVWDTLTHYAEKKRSKHRKQATDKALNKLGSKVDKLLAELEEPVPFKQTQRKDDECLVCLNEVAAIRTYPCCHKVLCQKCFFKTVNQAITKRALPLTCVFCRSKIIKVNNEQPHSSTASSKRSHPADHRHLSCNHGATGATARNTSKYNSAQVTDRSGDSPNSTHIPRSVSYVNPTFVDDICNFEEETSFTQIGGRLISSDVNGNIVTERPNGRDAGDCYSGNYERLGFNDGVMDKKRVRFSEELSYYQE